MYLRTIGIRRKFYTDMMSFSKYQCFLAAVVNYVCWESVHSDEYEQKGSHKIEIVCLET